MNASPITRYASLTLTGIEAIRNDLISWCTVDEPTVSVNPMIEFVRVEVILNPVFTL